MDEITALIWSVCALLFGTATVILLLKARNRRWTPIP